MGLRLRLPLVTAFAGMSLSAQATDINWCEEDPDTGHIYCPEILVRGGGLNDAEGDAAYTIAEYNDIDIEQNASGRIENLLRNTPNLQQFRRSDARSANPTSQGVTLRGLGGNAASRALVMLDGVPQSDPFGGWVSWASYDALPLRTVRVRRGGGTGADGPGALAGTVELYTLNRAADAGEPIAADILYGSRNAISARTQIAIAKRSGGQPGGILIGASYDRGDGFIPTIESQRGAVDSGAGYEQASLALKADASIAASSELQVNLRGFLDERDRGVPFSANRTGGIDASARVVRRGDWWDVSALAYAQLREFSSLFGSISANRSTVTPTLDQFAVPALGIGSRVEMRRRSDTGEIRLGADWRDVSGRTQEYYSYTAGVAQRMRRAGGSSVTTGVFAEYTHRSFRGLVVTGGLRLDKYWIGEGNLREVQLTSGATLTDSRFAPRSGTEWTGRAGLSWPLGGGVTLRASAYRGWRLPTLNELYRPFRVGTDAIAANAMLSPERLNGVEAGVVIGDRGTRMRPGNRVEVTAFHNVLKDAVANVTLARGPGVYPGVGFVAAGGAYKQRQNLPELRSNGVEVEAGHRIGPIDLEASWSLIDARIIEGALAGRRPAQVPKYNATASLAWRPDAYQGLSATLRYSSGQFEDDLNQLRLDDALTVDMHAMYRLSEKVQLMLRAENLFDSRVEAAISSSGIIERAMPRTIWAGIRFAID